MRNLTALTTAVQGGDQPVVTIDAVIEWVKSQAKKGDASESVAVVKVTSLRQMAEHVASDEPQGDARYVLANISKLRERWARKNQDGKASTAKTYASRAKASIEDYMRWSAAPDKYDPKARVSAKPSSKPVAKAKAAPEAVPTAPPPPPPAAPANTSGDVHECRLGKGREPFRYILPADGLQVADARRIAYHLITNCDDYDATTMTPIQVMTGTSIERA